jgi:hypothetical protein
MAFINYNHCSPRGSEKISKGDQDKIYPPLGFLRDLKENLKGGTRGYFDLS